MRPSCSQSGAAPRGLCAAHPEGPRNAAPLPRSGRARGARGSRESRVRAPGGLGAEELSGAGSDCGGSVPAVSGAPTPAVGSRRSCSGGPRDRTAVRIRGTPPPGHPAASPPRAGPPGEHSAPLGPGGTRVPGVPGRPSAGLQVRGHTRRRGAHLVPLSPLLHEGVDITRAPSCALAGLRTDCFFRAHQDCADFQPKAVGAGSPPPPVPCPSGAGAQLLQPCPGVGLLCPLAFLRGQSHPALFTLEGPRSRSRVGSWGFCSGQRPVCAFTWWGA